MSSEKVITIDRMAFGGEGVGRSEGKVVFVPFTIPGDKVRVQVLSDHGRYERAELVEVLEKSPHRVEPRCPVFRKCGGCQWQHMDYETQLSMKDAILKDALQRVGQVAQPVVLPMIPAIHPWHYRQRIQLKASSAGGIGFHAFHSHEVVPVEECFIAHEQLNAKLAELQGSRPKEGESFELSLQDEHVEMHKRQEGDVPFSQVNAEQNAHLIHTVLQFAFGNAELAFSRKKNVVELYAGSGNFTFPLAKRAGRIWAVESNVQAVQQGEEEMQRRGLENMDWIRGDAEWGLKKIYRLTQEKKIAIDILVMDPPRHGAKEILDYITLVKPRRVLYVSCDPMTLSRDIAFLCRRHYRLDQVQPVDMFPQTYHIESVAQLSLL